MFTWPWQMCKEVNIGVLSSDSSFIWAWMDFPASCCMCCVWLRVLPLEAPFLTLTALRVQQKLFHRSRHNLSFHYTADNFFSAGQILLDVTNPGHSCPQSEIHFAAMKCECMRGRKWDIKNQHGFDPNSSEPLWCFIVCEHISGKMLMILQIFKVVFILFTWGKRAN